MVNNQTVAVSVVSGHDSEVILRRKADLPLLTFFIGIWYNSHKKFAFMGR
jgi:hypothetical protein